MERLIRRIDLRAQGEDARRLLNQEWLVTNGLGGYASGTISGAVTWRYHGLLIAALPAPLGRVIMLNHLSEHLVLPDGRRVQIGGGQGGGDRAMRPTAPISSRNSGWRIRCPSGGTKWRTW